MATTEVFMSNRQYTDEFKAEAVKQVSDAGLEGIRVPGSYGPHPCQELHGSLGIVLPGDLRRAPAHRR